MKFIPFFLLLLMTSCGVKKERIPDYSPFDDDISFLRQYGPVITLQAPSGEGRVAVMPSLQARVMTSTAGGSENKSFGWINRRFFESGDTSIHMNAFGGEERIWLGPEGGQYSIFFAPDSSFTFENWRTPRLIDLDTYNVVEQGPHAARFAKEATLTNYSGTTFDIRLEREIRVVDRNQYHEWLGLSPDARLSCVAYQSINRLQNIGSETWRKSSGLLSIWLLGMFNPSPSLTMVIPYTPGNEEDLGPIVNDDYFGNVPSDRLKVDDRVIYFRGDGMHRSKIGLSPRRARNLMGSYDDASQTLTIIVFSTGQPDDVYVNSKWELQKNPYEGDVINAYNDGSPGAGQDPMGPFYELESSSPARELAPQAYVEHTQTTFHIQGDPDILAPLTRQLLGVTLKEIRSAF